MDTYATPTALTHHINDLAKQLNAATRQLLATPFDHSDHPFPEDARLALTSATLLVSGTAAALESLEVGID